MATTRTRQRRDGAPTAEEIKRRQENCPGHVASDGDPKVCGHCGIHIDEERPGDETIDDLAKILPAGDGAGPTVESVAERQADAAADSAPALGAGAGGDQDPSNSKSRYEIIKEKFDRLKAIKAEQKSLREEADEIVQDLAQNQTVNRGALSEVRKMAGLDAATIKARETSRKELFDLLIQPVIDEATAGEGKE